MRRSGGSWTAPSTTRPPFAEHRDQLDALAWALMERETLDEAEAYEAAHVEHAEGVRS
jgi:hypothetical protein